MTAETEARERECCLEMKRMGWYDHWRRAGLSHEEAAAKVDALLKADTPVQP